MSLARSRAGWKRWLKPTLTTLPAALAADEPAADHRHPGHQRHSEETASFSWRRNGGFGHESTKVEVFSPEAKKAIWLSVPLRILGPCPKRLQPRSSSALTRGRQRP